MSEQHPFAHAPGARIIVGLPHLSQGVLLRNARERGYPVMVSASSLARWDTIEHRGSRAREWKGWNTAPLDRLDGMDIEVHLDSAGFVAMALRGGYDWSPESYVHELASHRNIARFSSMDMCVEPEVAPDRETVKDRIVRTISLNRRCAAAARDAGSFDRFMPVIQGATAEDYVSCYEAVESLVPDHGTIGVGSMCRRKTLGADGSIAIVEALDANLPEGVTLHLFGVKSDSYEAMAMFGGRVSSVDSQAYGTRARCIANERRREDPDFSKTDAFVAKVMNHWFERQSARLSAPRAFPSQGHLSLTEVDRPRTVLDAAERLARQQMRDLIDEGALDFDAMMGPRLLEEWTCDILTQLPEGVGPMDPYRGDWQMPDAA